MKDQDKTEVKNVRQLCYYLGISSWSLYDWEKKFSIPKTEIKDDFDDIEYEKITRIATKKAKEIEKTINSSGEFNKSIELNLIKSLYANRFGSSTDKLKSHMISALINAWSEK